MSTLDAGVWQIYQNGVAGTLTIQSVDGAGNVIGHIDDENGTLTLQAATWGVEAKQFKFSRTLGNGEVQTFNGFVFDREYEFAPGQPTAAMAGTFIGSKFEDPRRPAFGWFAMYAGPGPG